MIFLVIKSSPLTHASIHVDMHKFFTVLFASSVSEYGSFQGLIVLKPDISVFGGARTAIARFANVGFRQVENGIAFALRVSRCGHIM